MKCLLYVLVVVFFLLFFWATSSESYAFSPQHRRPISYQITSNSQCTKLLLANFVQLLFVFVFSGGQDVCAVAI